MHFIVDLQNVDITLRILYRPVADRLPDIFTNLGIDYAERVLPSIVNEVLKAVVVSTAYWYFSVYLPCFYFCSFYHVCKSMYYYFLWRFIMCWHEFVIWTISAAVCATEFCHIVSCPEFAQILIVNVPGNIPIHARSKLFRHDDNIQSVFIFSSAYNCSMWFVGIAGWILCMYVLYVCMREFITRMLPRWRVIGAVWRKRVDHTTRGRITQDHRRVDDTLRPLWTYSRWHFHRQCSHYIAI